MAAGLGFTIQPRRGPKSHSRITVADPGRRFATESRLPLCRLTFDHTVDDLPGGACG